MTLITSQQMTAIVVIMLAICTTLFALGWCLGRLTK